MGVIFLGAASGFSVFQNDSFSEETKSEPYIPELSKLALEKGVISEWEAIEGAKFLSHNAQPLIRLISRPEEFLDRVVLTTGYLRVYSDKDGLLFLNEMGAKNFYNLNKIHILGPLQLEAYTELKKFDNKFVLIRGKFSTLSGELYIFEITRLTDLTTHSDKLEVK